MLLYPLLRKLLHRLSNDAHDRVVIKPHMTDAQISRQLKEAAPSPNKAFKPLVGMTIDLVLLAVLLGIGWRVIRYFLAF